MGNTCAGLSGPIRHRSYWGAISRSGGNSIAHSGSGSPRDRKGSPGIPRAGKPHGWADFWEPPSSTHLWHISSVAIGRQWQCRRQSRETKVGMSGKRNMIWLIICSLSGAFLCQFPLFPSILLAGAASLPVSVSILLVRLMTLDKLFNLNHQAYLILAMQMV